MNGETTQGWSSFHNPFRSPGTGNEAWAQIHLTNNILSRKAGRPKLKWLDLI
jgi:hypothetical protein